jgi:hypothetical protein
MGVFMVACKPRVALKDGKVWVECDGDETHRASKVDCSNGALSFTHLKKNNALVKIKAARKINAVAAFMNSLICAYWQTTHKSISKKAIREAFPGLGGDLLNICLLELVEARLVAQGDCGCCYVPAYIDGVFGRGVR